MSDEILADVKHRLHTPMSVVTGLAEVLTEGVYGGLTSGQLRRVAMISEASQTLLRAVNDFIDFSEVVEGPSKLRPQPIPVREVWNSATALLETPVARRGIDMGFDLDPVLPTIFADRRAMIQTLVHCVKRGIDCAVEHAPDVVLMDLRMPVMDGVEAIRRLREKVPEAKVLVLTTYDTDELVYDAIRAGARGYLLKDVASSDLTDAIRTVHRGGSLLQPVVVERLLDRLGPRELKQSAPVEDLTPRELEVLACMSTGARNREIAEKLVIAERTVKIHVANVIAKLGATNRTEAIVTALDLGMVDRSDSAS